MKNVFSRKEVPHIWANKGQDEGRNSNDTIYFKGDTIYSYGPHFPIARHVKNANHQSAVLFTKWSYSNTTAKHISWTRVACSHLHVINVWNPTDTPEDNFDKWFEQAKEIAEDLLNPRKKKILIYLKLEEIRREVVRYASFFGYEIPKILEDAYSIKDPAEYEKLAEAEKVEKEKREKAAEVKRKEAEALRKKDFMANVQKFVHHKIDYLYGRYDRDYLRLSKDKMSIETSQGVIIKWEDARHLWIMIKDEHLRTGYNVNHMYKVSLVTKNEVKIGCHTFPTKYLIDFGKKIFAA